MPAVHVAEMTEEEDSVLIKKSAMPSHRVASLDLDQPGKSSPWSLLGALQAIIGPATPPTTRVSESLDYEPVQNRVFFERLKEKKDGKKKVWGYTGHTLAKFMVTFLTGILTGITAFYMSKANDSIIEAKLDYVQSSMDAHPTYGLLTAFLWFWCIGGVMVAFATALVQYWAPASAGAGVTLVMAYLNGNHIPNLLRLSTLITKFVGTVCAVGGGLPMGPEGPMVHLGACIASVITYIELKCVTDARWGSCWGRQVKNVDLKEKLKVLDEIVSDTDHREFVSAGVSAGISAAFGAPIGGVLFSMEEACSFWSRKTAWRCFIAAILSTFTIQLLNKSAAQHGVIGFTNLVALDNIEWLEQLPFIIINASVAGILGAAFNSLRMWLWKLRASKTRHLLRIAEVIGLVFIVALCGFFWGWAAGTCLPTPEDWVEDGYGMQFRCPAGQHNDVATLFLSSSHHTIIKLFSIGHDVSTSTCTTSGGGLRRRGLLHAHAWLYGNGGADMSINRNPVAVSLSASVNDALAGGGRALTAELQASPYTKGSLALFVACYLILMSVGAGLAIPGGLFMPAILLGAASGALWGLIVRDWLPTWNIQPGVYALMAASGVLGGVFRSAISLVILVVEGSRGIDFLMGVIMAVVIANWVAHWIHHDGVYESELERIGNVYMLRDEAPHRLQTLTVEAMMATGVYGFRPVESVERILEVLRTTLHNGFPVWLNETSSLGVDDAIDVEQPMTPPLAAQADGVCGPEGAYILEGIILRNQLLVLLQRRHFCDASGHLLGREPDDKYEFDLETEMKTFFRRYYTHNRWVSATKEPLDALQLDTPGDSLPGGLATLYLDLRPFMNRSPFVVRKDCSASRAHQVFVSLGLRHLITVDAHNRVVGIITRKDLDHAAGHGWWRMSHMAEPPNNSFFRKMQNHALSTIGKAASSLTKNRSVSYLKSLVSREPGTPPAVPLSPGAWPATTSYGSGYTGAANNGAAPRNSEQEDAAGRNGSQLPARGFSVRFADESSLLSLPMPSEGARLYAEKQAAVAAAAQEGETSMLAANASLRD